MRANQPMGLVPSVHAITDGLVRVESERFYEGYWGERYPLGAYVPITPALAGLVAARDEAAAALANAVTDLEVAARAVVASGGHAYEEYEQAVLYSSGPCMFLALRTPDGTSIPDSLWSECAMEVAAEGVCPCGGELCTPECPEGCVRAEGGADPMSEDEWVDPKMPG